MPRTKKTTEPEVSAPAAEAKRKRAKATPAVAADAPMQPEPAVRKRSSAAKTAAVSHKHAHKKAFEPAEQPDPSAPRHVAHDDIARLAWSYWEARGFQGGSPEEDWLRAERELLIAAQNG